MKKPLQVYTERSFSRPGVDVWILERDAGGRVTHCGQIHEDGEMTFHPYEQGTLRPKPTFNLSETHALELVAALTEINIKPPDEAKVYGLYEAQTKHLKDMRKIVEKQMDVKLEEPK